MEMSRKIYPYSLDRKDAKIAGVCSTIGAKYGIDPTFVRIGFVAAAIFISFKLTLVAYAAIGIYLTVQKKRAMTGERHLECRRENAHVCGSVLGGQQERRFGQVELQCERLHRRVVESAAILEHAQRIAFERRFGEHVDDSIRVVVHLSS